MSKRVTRSRIVAVDGAINSGKDRIDCPICWRPVTNSEVGLQMHQASVHCLTWRYRNEGYDKWQAQQLAEGKVKQEWMKQTKPNLPRSRTPTKRTKESRSSSRRQRRMEAAEEEELELARQKRKEREARARAEEEEEEYRRRRAQKERDREATRRAERALQRQREYAEEEDRERRRRERQEEAQRQKDREARKRAQAEHEKKTVAEEVNVENKESSSDSYYSSSSEEQDAGNQGAAGEKLASAPAPEKTGQVATKKPLPVKTQQAAPKLPAAPARQVEQSQSSQPAASDPSGSAQTAEKGIDMVERLLKAAINAGASILRNEPAGCKKE